VWDAVETLKQDGIDGETVVHGVLVTYRRRGSGDCGDWRMRPPGTRTTLRSRVKFLDYFGRITVAAAAAAANPAPAPLTAATPVAGSEVLVAGSASPSRAARPWGRGGTRRSGYYGGGGTASVALYQYDEVGDGFCRSKRRRQGRVLGFVPDITDEEISEAVAEESADVRAYWAFFGVGTAAHNAATVAAASFNADGVPTQTGRRGGDQWRLVAAHARTAAAEYETEG